MMEPLFRNVGSSELASIHSIKKREDLFFLTVLCITGLGLHDNVDGGIPNLCILDKTQTGVFSILGFLVNPLSTKIVIILDVVMNIESSNDIDMKLGPITKLDKRKTTTSKKIDVMLVNYDVIVIFPIYG